jgi:hypothetical protein
MVNLAGQPFNPWNEKVLSLACRSSQGQPSREAGSDEVHAALIQQGDTPTPYSPEEWGHLPEEEQNAVYAAYKAINETPGRQPRPADATAGGGHQPLNPLATPA